MSQPLPAEELMEAVGFTIGSISEIFGDGEVGTEKSGRGKNKTNKLRRVVCRVDMSQWLHAEEL